MALSLADVLAHLPEEIRDLFEDPAVTEVMLNPDGSVWRERHGRVERVRGVRVKPRRLQAAALAIARPLGHDADAERPLVDARLPDGSRVAICGPPVTEAHAITVRRFAAALTLDDLIANGSVDPKACQPALDALAARRNVLISGGTGSGKTTLLGALAGRLDKRERVVVIEDTRELPLEIHNSLRMEARRGEEEVEPITVRDLVRHSLRHRPDRVIVGEVRGEEAYDLLQALNTGHGGSLSTIHARSAGRGPGRLAACAMQAAADVPWDVLCGMVGEAIDVVVHVGRDYASGKRGVREVLELERYDPDRAAWIWAGPAQPAEAAGE